MRIDAKRLPDASVWNVIDANTGLRVMNVFSADDERHEIEVWTPALRMESRYVPKVVIDCERRVVLINVREEFSSGEREAQDEDIRIAETA